MNKVPPEERTPYVIVAFQECERMNTLTNEIRRSLKELDLGLKVTRMSIFLNHKIQYVFLNIFMYVLCIFSLILFNVLCCGFIKLQGELTITSDMEDLGNALYLDGMPESWAKRAYPSLFGLAQWYADLLLRVKELETWVSDFQLPAAVWLAGFFNPQSFLTAIMQQVRVLSDDWWAELLIQLSH